MKNWKSSLMATVALTCFGAVESANAQTYIYGGGASFPAPVYRQLFDCVSAPANGYGTSIPQMAIAAACPNALGNYPSLQVLVLYSAVGSSNGKKAFAEHNPASLPTPPSSVTVPYTSSLQPSPGAYPYPTIHFAGSDDPWFASDQTTYDTANATYGKPNGGTADFGHVIQVPAVIGPVSIAYNNDGAGNPIAADIKLSRKALCGIFSGHITQWNNAILTADNGGQIGTGTIKVVHRSDGSGTNYLFTSALAAQCVSEFGPNSESDPTVVSYEFPWSDRKADQVTNRCDAPHGTAPAGSNALPYRGSNETNWPDKGTDQCGTAIPNPGGGTFVGVSGNSSIAAYVMANAGAIGYSTADYVQPVVSSGAKTAKLENYWGEFVAPTPQASALAMQSASPVFDDTTRKNALIWSAQAVAPYPKSLGSYPIAGFSFINTYQCYADTNVATWLKNLLQWTWGDAVSAQIIEDNGFAVPPNNWLLEVQKLVFGADGINGANCAGKPGAN
ncbi:MAG: phosphatase [Methylacidiphilales bacterium]|nr:phosphatase [Candidatus Methylacidiphilales bacterium]